MAANVNHAFIVKNLSTREQCVRFAEENNLIPATKMCRVHKKLMKINYGNHRNVGSFVCNKGNCRARSRVARGTGTWFEDIRIGLPRAYHLMYSFSQRWSYQMAIFEDPERNLENRCLSKATVSDWYDYCRETVVTYQLDHQEILGKIGGPGKVVKIYESKFGKRKYNKGQHLEGHWVIGLIEDGSKDLHLEVCPENVTEVLVTILKKHVVEGTTIHTDNWRAYDCLGEHGYIHKKVIKLDPENSSVAPDSTHTQKIEPQWRIVKRYFKRDIHNHRPNFTDIIVEYLWRRSVDRNKLDPFMELIKAIKHVYSNR